MCMEGVWKVSGRCLEGVWKVSGKCLEGVWKVSGRCLEAPDWPVWPHLTLEDIRKCLNVV